MKRLGVQALHQHLLVKAAGHSMFLRYMAYVVAFANGTCTKPCNMQNSYVSSIELTQFKTTQIPFHNFLFEETEYLCPEVKYVGGVLLGDVQQVDIHLGTQGVTVDNSSTPMTWQQIMSMLQTDVEVARREDRA